MVVRHDDAGRSDLQGHADDRRHRQLGMLMTGRIVDRQREEPRLLPKMDDRHPLLGTRGEEGPEQVYGITGGADDHESACDSFRYGNAGE